MATLPASVCTRRVIGRFPCLKQTLKQTRFSFKSSDRKSKITLGTHKNKHPLRNKTEIYGSKTHFTDSDDGNITAFFFWQKVVLLAVLSPVSSGNFRQVFTCFNF